MNEAFEKVAKDEAQQLSIVQESTIRSTDYLRRIIAPDGGQGGVTISCLCPNCNSFPLEDYVWWSLGEKGVTIGGVRFVEKKTTGSIQTGSRCCKEVKVLIRPRSAVPRGLCGNLINALKLLANQQEDGDGLTQNIVTNFGEGNRKGLTNGLRDFKKIGDHRALEVGYLNEGLGNCLKHEGQKYQKINQR